MNGLKFSSDGLFLAAAVGQEHRLGRWWRIKAAKNALCLVSLDKRQEPKPQPTEHAAEPGRRAGARGGRGGRAGSRRGGGGDRGKRTSKRRSARI